MSSATMESWATIASRFKSFALITESRKPLTSITSVSSALVWLLCWAPALKAAPSAVITASATAVFCCLYISTPVCVVFFLSSVQTSFDSADESLMTPVSDMTFFLPQFRPVTVSCHRQRQTSLISFRYFTRFIAKLRTTNSQPHRCIPCRRCIPIGSQNPASTSRQAHKV